MNRLLSMVVLVVGIVTTAVAGAASQDRFELPQPYLDWERSYLKDFPELQRVMDDMVQTTARQLKDPSQDILHNRVTSALVYKMALDLRVPPDAQKLALVADLLHNIHKEDKAAVLTGAEVMKQSGEMISRLRAAGYFKASPRFWSDEAVLKNPKIGNNRALIHHITSALEAGRIMREIGGYSRQDIERVEAAVVAHSTGYWYFRDSIDQLAGRKGAWQAIYPEPESLIDKLAHDADLISQFEVVSVIPEGSKWRVIAAKRWGAKNAAEEAHIVYYVFFRLFEEARTEAGKALAREEWRKIQPELIKLMGLPAADDPIKVLGVPKVFQRN